MINATVNKDQTINSNAPFKKTTGEYLVSSQVPPKCFKPVTF